MLSLDDRIDLACDRFEQLWKSPEPLRIEDVLDEFEPHESENLLEELLAVELELRIRAGENPSKNDYLARLPKYQALIAILFDTQIDELMRTVATGSAPPQQIAVPKKGESVQRRIPDRIGKYRIVEALDRGGQATVFRAVHPELGRDVVIKFCHHRQSTNPEAQESLRSEGRLLAGWEHENLAKVYDFDFHQGRAYLVMELVRGLNLQQYVKQISPSREQWVRLMIQVAAALRYVHSQGALHLDLKPQNILVDESGKPRLIDFGLSRRDDAWEKTGDDPAMLSGTLQFMAPEQARCDSEQIDPRSDIYGMGGVLYFCAVGTPPVTGTNFDSLLKAARKGDWDRQSLHSRCEEPLRSVIEKSMAYEPAERYHSIDELVAALEKCIARPSTKIWTAVTAVVTCLIAVVWMLASSFSELPPLTSSEMQIRVLPAESPSGVSFDLLDRQTVSSGDAIVISLEAPLPADAHVSLFLFDSEGKLSLVDTVDAAQDQLEYRFPRSDFQEIAGPAGTEFFFLCGRREAALSEEEIASIGSFNSPLPSLPDDTLVRVRSDSVRLANRGLGGTVEGADPIQQTLDQLKRARAELVKQCDFVEGLAFAHVE